MPNSNSSQFHFLMAKHPEIWTHGSHHRYTKEISDPKHGRVFLEVRAQDNAPASSEKAQESQPCNSYMKVQCTASLGLVK